MIRLFVRHTVKDYAAWRTAYDAFQAAQGRSLGITADAVYRGVENPNDITVSHDFETLKAAQTLAGSDQLREAMAKAGVVGAPQIWFVEPA